MSCVCLYSAVCGTAGEGVGSAPVGQRLVSRAVRRFRVASFSGTAVHRMGTVTTGTRATSKIRFVGVRVNMPNLPPSAMKMGTRVRTLRGKVTDLCPSVGKLPRLGSRTSGFVGTFVSVSLGPRNYMPIAKSVRNAFTSFLAYDRYSRGGSAVLFVSPNFPIRGRRLIIVKRGCRAFSMCSCQKSGLGRGLRDCLGGKGVSTIVCSGPGGPD